MAGMSVLASAGIPGAGIDGMTHFGVPDGAGVRVLATDVAGAGADVVVESSS